MKDLTASLKAHLRQGVTTICTCMEVRRKDGKSYRFTDHDEPVVTGATEYVPYSSFARSSISTGADLEVDQMEIRGILNSKYIARDDVAAGLFDFAEVRVFVLNYEKPDEGAVTLRLGWLGEVTMNEDSTFTAELRGLSQVYTYRIGEAYQPECRADLGDRRCRIALNPRDWTAGTSYRKGDVVLGVINAADGYDNLNFVNPSFDQDAATLPNLVRDLPGWTTYGDPNGRWTLRQTMFFGLAGKESYAAFGTDNGVDGGSPAHSVPDLGMYQVLDLDAQGADLAQIDGGLCRLYSTLWYACVNGREAGTRYRIFALDAAGNQIGAAALYDTGLRQTAEDRWFQEVIRDVLLPSGTRFIKFDLFAHKRYRYTEGAAFDTITAAINYPNGTLGGADQYGDVAFQAANSGVSGLTTPAWSNLIGDTVVDGAITWNAVKSWKQIATVNATGNGGRTIIPVGVDDSPGYYDGGLLVWETGLNAGRSQEIKSWSDGSLYLFQRPFNLPQVGDRFVLHPGCDKTRATCSEKFSNVINFRGEPDVPGQDKYYQTPNAPSM